MRFYFITIIFILSVCLVYITVSQEYSFLTTMILATIYLSVSAYGSIQISSQMYVKTFCKKVQAKGRIAISFDDGPEPINTQKILAILKKYNAKASFFEIGKKCELNTDIVRQIHADGHLIGNHTYSHSNYFPLFNVRKMRRDIKATQDVINKITHEKVKYFRPPFGVTNPLLRRAISAFDFIIAGWSIRTLDTVKSKEEVINKIKNKVKSGDIILLHSTTESIDLILEQTLIYLKSKSLKAVRIDEI